MIHMLVYVACLPQRTQPCDGISYRTRVSVSLSTSLSEVIDD